MTCENVVTWAAPLDGCGPFSAQKSAQISCAPSLSAQGAVGRAQRIRPPWGGQRPPTSPRRSDPEGRLRLLLGGMETTTPPSALTTPASDTLLLTLDEAARLLCCARRTLERHVASRSLRVVHLGRSVRVERRELDRFVAQLRTCSHG